MNPYNDRTRELSDSATSSQSISSSISVAALTKVWDNQECRRRTISSNAKELTGSTASNQTEQNFNQLFPDLITRINLVKESHVNNPNLSNHFRIIEWLI